MRRVQSLAALEGYQPNEPTPTAPSSPPPDMLGMVQQQTESINACMVYQADAIDRLTQAITDRPAPAKAWTFTIKRDARGETESITATAK